MSETAICDLCQQVKKIFQKCMCSSCYHKQWRAKDPEKMRRIYREQDQRKRLRAIHQNGACACGRPARKGATGLCGLCYQAQWRNKNREHMRKYGKWSWKTRKHEYVYEQRSMPDESPLLIFLRAFGIERKELAHYIFELRERNQEPVGHATRELKAINRLTA